MASIATNLISLFTQRGLNTVQSALSTSVQRLSSGVRINVAKDDAAGLGISQELQRQTRAFAVSSRNANDAVSMVQTAEGALQSVGDMLQRLKTLTTQGVNESLSKDQRAFVADEIAQLRDEINAVATRTTFNGTSLLTGDFSQAVQGEFVKAAELDASANSVLRTSTIKIGEESEANADVTKSLFSFADVQVDDAAEGTYSLSNDGADVTLSRVVGNVTETQTLTLVSGVATARNQVAFNNTLNDSFTLDFSDFGVSITVKNERIGGSDRSASEIATKISAIGITPNEDYQNQGWKTVEGADWADAANFGLAAGATLKAIITSTAGNIKLSSTAGITSVKGYNGAVADGGVTNGSLTDGSVTELGFKGTAAQLNAVLADLKVNNTTGLGEISVDIVPTAISVFTSSSGVTSYYEVKTKVGGGNISWTDARAGALASDFGPLDGYLANITSAEEQAFIKDKVSGLAWFGATDETTEDVWVWADGPEAGVQFWQGNGSGAGGTAFGGRYSNWSGGVEPNDAGGEDYAHVLNDGFWNDYADTTAVTQYIVEYGGVAGITANTSKTILIGTPGYINVGNALTLDSVQTTGVGSGMAETGIYKMTADASAKTLTLKRFDVDGETLLGSQTISEPDGVGSGRYKTLTFDQLGVSVDVTNVSDREITFGDAESGLTAELDVASSRMASLIGENGPIFQTGVGSRNDIAINVFRDIRLGKNADSQNATLFNEVNDLVNRLDQASDPATADFQTLENRVEDMITAIADIRGDMGAVQNRLAATRNNIAEQFTNLSAAQSQILDTDFAAETARLTRMQIGQQASTAMLAQANQLPNVILALLQ
jgi:flagellin